jgi:peptide/nickel transport system ATP-binding protein
MPRESFPSGPGAAAMAVELRGVSRFYDGTPVIDHLNLGVPVGTSVGIRGGSGSGKSTLARILAGVDRGFSGERIAAPGGLHLVFQDSLQSLNPRIPLGWSLAEALSDGRFLSILSAGRAGRAEVYRVLGDVGLPEDVAGMRPTQLSGGQRQRVALARALLSGARTLVLDEPVAALDPSVQARILNLLVRLHGEKGVTLVVISHDHAVLDYLCGTQFELRGGRLWQTTAHDTERPGTYDEPEGV